MSQDNPQRRPPLAALFFIIAGTLHFTHPRFYRRIMPPYIPAPDVMVAASGIAEIAGGAGLLIPRTRRLASWWLIATLLAIFPANVHMALHPDQFRKVPGGAKALYARLPLQALMILWVRRSAR